MCAEGCPVEIKDLPERRRFTLNALAHLCMMTHVEFLSALVGILTGGERLNLPQNANLIELFRSFLRIHITRLHGWSKRQMVTKPGVRIHILLVIALLVFLIPYATAFATEGGSQETGKTSTTRTFYQNWKDSERNRDVPVKIYINNKATTPAPVVIFSHGLGGSVEAASYLGEYLSDQGYICIHVQHAGSDLNLIKSAAPDGRAAIMERLRTAANGENLRARITDIEFVLSELEKRNQSDPVLRNKLDLSKIGMAGHSFGAGTTLALAGQTYTVGRQTLCFRDPRIKAAIYLSPPVNLQGRDPHDMFGSITVPGLLMTGTEDNSPIGQTDAKSRVIPYQCIKATDQYLVNFFGGDHMIFSGRTNPLRARRDEQFHNQINKIASSFLDAYLKNDKKQQQWLQKNGANYLHGSAEFMCK